MEKINCYIQYFHVHNNAPCLSTKICITHVSNFSWVLQWSQEKSKTMLMQNLEGRVNKVHYDLRENIELKRLLFSKGFNPQRISRDLQWVINIKYN